MYELLEFGIYENVTDYLFRGSNGGHILFRGIIMQGLWTKSYIFMIISMLFLFTSFYMLYPTLPMFIKEIGGDESHVGLSMGVFMLTAVIFRPFVGGLLDRFGSRPFIISGIILFSLSMYTYEWVGGIFILLVLRLLHGMSWGISSTSMQTAITNMIPSKRRGEGLGWSGMAMTFAMAIGPMFGIWIAENMSYHSLFLFAAILSSFSLFLTFGAKISFEQNNNMKRKIVFFEKTFFPISIAIFFLFISYGGITTFVPLFANSINSNSGTFFLIYAIVLIITRPIAGKLSDKYGETLIIVPSLLITIVSLLVLSNSNGLIGLFISAVLYGCGFGSAQPALQSATVSLVPSEQSGVANASFSTATDLGIGLGAMILGLVSQHTSYQTIFIFGAISVFLSFLTFTFLAKPLLKKKHLVDNKSSTYSSKEG